MDSSTRPNTFLPLSLFLSISALLFFLAKDRIPNSFLSFFPYALLFFLAIDRTPTSRNSMVQLAIAVFFFSRKKESALGVADGTSLSPTCGLRCFLQPHKLSATNCGLSTSSALHLPYQTILAAPH